MNKEVIIDIENPKDNDLISRQAVLDMLEDINAETEGVGFYYEHYVDYIKSLSSVKPQEKTGHWIVHEHAEEFYGRVVDNYECDNCSDWYLNKTNFCPNCGVRMVEPQESEEV